jgi:hypothetical protein
VNRIAREPRSMTGLSTRVQSHSRTRACRYSAGLWCMSQERDRGRYRFKGPAVVHDPGNEGFLEGLRRLREGGSTLLERVKAIVVIEVQRPSHSSHLLTSMALPVRLTWSGSLNTASLSSTGKCATLRAGPRSPGAFPNTRAPRVLFQRLPGSIR